MLSVQQLSGKANDWVKYLKEYYNHNGETMLPKAIWFGSACDALGLNENGRDLDNDFIAVMSGYDPNNCTVGKKGQSISGTKLIKNASLERERMGWDLTFAPEKDFSLLVAGASDDMRDKLVTAHMEAVKETLTHLQEYITSRTGKQGTGEELKSEPIIRIVNHLDSRNGDPHLHSHCVVANMGLRSDGKYGCIDGAIFRDAKHAMGAIYRELNARNVEALGFGVEKVRETNSRGEASGEVTHRVVGISDEMREHFSSRSNDIEQYAKEHDVSRDEACLRTRTQKDKEESNPEKVVANFKNEIQSMNKDWVLTDDLIGREGKFFQSKSLDATFAQLHKHESAFNQFDLMRDLAKEGCVITSRNQMQELLQERLQSGELLPCRENNGKDQFCTKWHYELQRNVLVTALAHKDDPKKLDDSTIENAIKKHERAKQKETPTFALNAEQREGVRHACADGQTALILGKAGTGKTSMIGAVMQAHEDAGYTVIGTSTSTGASDNLARDTGRTAMSIASLLAKLDAGSFKFTNRTLLVIDEMGMVGADPFRQLQVHMERAGGKIVGMGDHFQLQPVLAGTPFRDLIGEIGGVELKEIRRQRTEPTLEMAKALYGDLNGNGIIQKWDANGWLHTSEKRKDVVNQLISDYLNHPNDPRNKLVMADTHKDLHAVNGAIRHELKSQGKLQDDRTVEAWAKLGNGREKKEEINIAVGDRIRFTQADGAGVPRKPKDFVPDFINGSTGVLVGFGNDTKKVQMMVRLESDDPTKEGKIITVDTSNENGKHFTHAYAQSVHSAQGLGIDKTFWLANGSTADRNIAMVAFTRTKESFSAYMTEADKPVVSEKLDQWRFKESALELVNKPTIAQTLDELKLSVDVIKEKDRLPKQVLAVKEQEQNKNGLPSYGHEPKQTLKEMNAERHAQERSELKERASVASDAYAVATSSHDGLTAEKKLVEALRKEAVDAMKGNGRTKDEEHRLVKDQEEKVKSWLKENDRGWFKSGKIEKSCNEYLNNEHQRATALFEDAKKNGSLIPAFQVGNLPTELQEMIHDKTVRNALKTGCSFEIMFKRHDENKTIAQTIIDRTSTQLYGLNNGLMKSNEAVDRTSNEKKSLNAQLNNMKEIHKLENMTPEEQTAKREAEEKAREDKKQAELKIFQQLLGNQSLQQKQPPATTQTPTQKNKSVYRMR